MRYVQYTKKDFNLYSMTNILIIDDKKYLLLKSSWSSGQLSVIPNLLGA